VCPTTLPPGTQLLTVVDTTHGQMPFAVRMHIADVKQGHHALAIGIPCYNRWCVLKRDANDKLLDFTAAGDKNRIPGWHDEQFLSFRQGGGDRVSRVRARIAPVDSLDDMTFDGTFKHAAEINLTGADPAALPHYRSKWQLPSYNWETPIKLALQRDGNGEWWAQYSVSGLPPGDPVRVDQKHIPLIASRRSQGMLVQLTSTARWGFASDGGAWVRCADGCCTVS
jgi:hypothetical protein